MFENIGSFFKKIMKNDTKELVSDTTATNTSKEAAKERLQLVLMQDRANVSADFLELMKQEIVDVIKKYIVIEEDTIDVRIINQENEDGTNGAPSLCANIPILNIRNDNKGEKFRKEQSVDITKDIVSAQKVEDSSDNTSNDNVKIENDDLNNKDIEEEKEEEKEEDIVKDNNESEVKINELNDDGLVDSETDLIDGVKESELEIVNENVFVEDVKNKENEEIDNNLNDELNNNVEELGENNNIILNSNEENLEEYDEDIDNLEEIEKRANEAMMNSSINYDYDDEEDDDDVTFDDLLKAAEEEEKMQKEAKEVVEKKVSPKPKSAARSARGSKSTKSKSTTKTASKRKKTTKK